MAPIMVVADDARDLKQIASAMRERATVADLESEHFRRQLLERVGWAVEDTEAGRKTEQ